MQVLETECLGQKISVKYADSVANAKSIVKELQKFDKLYLDIETSPKGKFVGLKEAGLDPLLSEISVVSFYGGGSVGYVVSLNTVPFDIFIPLLESKKLYCFYAPFEYAHFQDKGCKTLNISCLMVAHAMVMKAKLPEFKQGGNSLATAVEYWFGCKVSKHLQTSTWNTTLTAEQIRYSFLDSFYTFKLAQTLGPEIKKYKIGRVVRLMIDLIPVIVEMQQTGIKIDVGRHNKLIKRYQDSQDGLDKELKEYFYGYNPMSAKQFDAWCRASLKKSQLKDWTKTKGRKGKDGKVTGQYYSADTSTLTEHQDIDAIKILMKAKENYKFLNTYGMPLQEKMHPVTRRIHSGFNIVETSTGRLSSRNPNAQNYPREIEFREIFCADKGNVLVVSDFSQIETRLAGIVSGDPEINSAYEKGEDIYKTFAAKLYGKRVKDISKEERAHAKTAILGFAYGMSAKKLKLYAKGMGVSITDKTAAELFDGYHKIFNVYSSWCTEVRSKYTPAGYVRTKLGRIRILDMFEGEFNGYTVVPNTVIQGSAAEVIFCSMIHLYKKNLPAKILLSVHDELVLECRSVDAKKICSELSDSMVQGFLQVFPGSCVKGLAEAFSGENWAQAKDPEEYKKYLELKEKQ